MKTSLTCVLLFFISFNAKTQRGMLIGESNSPLGSHLLFHPTEKSLPIFNHFIKQNHFKHSSTQFNTSLTNFDRPDFDLPREFEVLDSSVGFFQIENKFIEIFFIIRVPHPDALETVRIEFLTLAKTMGSNHKLMPTKSTTCCSTSIISSDP